MSSDQRDPGYIRYQDYSEIKRQFDRTLDSNPDDDRFKKIIKEINNGSHKWNLNNETFIQLHNVLSNDHALSTAIKPHYCRYINHWLNKEVQKTDNDVNASYFHIFKEFSEKLSVNKTRRKDQSCKDYFFDLGDETINNIEFLYNLYDVYNQIKSHSPDDRVKGCGKLELLSLNYRQSVYDYYVKNEDKDLYNKLEYIIGSIDQMTRIKTSSPCTQKIYFTKPRELENLLKEEAQKKADAEAAARKVQEEAADKQGQIGKDLEQQKLLQPKDLITRLPNNELQEVLHGHGEFHSSTYQAGSREFETSRLQRPTQKFGYSQRPESSTGLLWKNDPTQREPIPYTKEGTEYENEVIKEQDDKGTTQSGTFFGSSGIPGYITEVFGSVDPVPVVGVSGGMGALFLLFRYTPLGTFFIGGRGRAHRIPRSFNGQFLGAFPDINEYEGGYIGYGPMNIPYGAE